MLPPPHKVASRASALSTLALLLALLLHATCSRASGSPSDVYHSPVLYDWGFHGLHPKTWYHSYDGSSPLLNYLKWDDRCDQGHYLMSPRGTIVSRPGPLITDARGNLVWSTDRFGEVTDFKMQTYQGRNYLTFWAGTNGVGHRFGHGVYYMLDDTYQVFKTIKPVGDGLSGDLHDFFITDAGTALMTVYAAVPGDLSSVGGPHEGWILDSMFQEVDIATGRLLFQWKASDHVPVADTMRVFAGSDLGAGPEQAFDYIHINSVDKDADGNYIISNRHTHTVMAISPQAKTLWVLGGKANMFKDLSAGRATDFTWQHHARYQGNNTISIFDNAKSETTGDHYVGRYSRGMLLQLDTDKMRVKMLHEYAHPSHGRIAQSQGSMQTVRGTGNVLLSYGFLPTFSEFAADGELLCDIRIAPWLIFKAGMVTSYRTFKSLTWVGRPLYPPTVFLRPADAVLFVSWHGATEVARWALQGANWADVRDGQFDTLDEQDKDGYEAGFHIRAYYPDYVRVAAVDAQGQVLSHSAILNRHIGNAPSTFKRTVLVTLGVVLSICLALAFLFRRRIIIAVRKHKARKDWKAPKGCRVGEATSWSLGQVTRRWQGWRKASTHELEPLYQD